MNWIEACIDRSRTIVMILGLIIIAGIYAYVTIPKERNPDIQIPIIFISIHFEGAAPEDSERLIIRPIETSIRSIEGIKEITSYARESNSSVIIEFIAGTDIDVVLQDVREKIDRVRPDLPDDIDEPVIKEVNFSQFPVITAILTGEVPERTLIRLANDLQNKIEAIGNVLNAEIAGDREEVVELIINPSVLESYGFDLEDVFVRALGNNKLIAAGTLNTEHGLYSVKVPGLLENIDDILSLPVAQNNNAVVTVGDVAQVRKTFRQRTGYARVNGQPAIALEISKRSGTNIIETIGQVKALIAKEQAFWPEHLQVIYSQDTSSAILRILHDLENNILLAILLVMLVIIYYVGARPAGLIVFAIPGAFLTGILLLFFLDLTLNIVVLFSLILSIGMLVDSAIIVTEFADCRIREGMKKKQAYALAANVMKWPIITSTITTLVVFMPLLFWPGIVGQFMQYMPITLIATLTGSLFMALIFLPVLGTLLSRDTIRKKTKKKKIETEQTGTFTKAYGLLLANVIKRPLIFAAIIMASLIVVIGFYSQLNKGTEFFPKIEPDNARILVRARGNLSVNEQDAIMQAVEKRIYKLADEVRIFYTRTGDFNRDNIAEDVIGIVQLEFADWRTRRKAQDILDQMQLLTADIYGVEIEAEKERKGPLQGKPIEIEIGSRYPELLQPVVEQTRDIMSQIGGFKDIEDNRPLPVIEWNLDVDRKEAALFNLNVESIGRFIKLVTNGLLITTYRPNDNDEEVDLLLRFPLDKSSTTMLDQLKVTTSQGNIPISNFVKRVPKAEVSTINRASFKRVMAIKADVEAGVNVDNQVTALVNAFRKTNIDPRVSINFKGEDEEQKQTAQFLSQAFLLALFCMALILVTQFNSVFDMFIILSAVFLSTVGVLLGLMLTQQPFGIVMCGVGVIALSGVVVNNNIIFIDTYKFWREKGFSVEEALVTTGQQRLRPILLTAGTTILGLIPMVLGMNIDFLTREVTFGAPSSQWWQQLSTSIAGGLTFATILTLFFTPCLLTIGERLSRHLQTPPKLLTGPVKVNVKLDKLFSKRSS